MQAVVVEGREVVRLVDVPEPVLAGPRSAIVSVDKTAICGSDMLFYKAKFGDAAGIRPGHEFVGTVVEVGPEVGDLKPGDRVIDMALFGCGRCHGCQDLRPTACSEGWMNFGTIHELPGGQAQLVHIPNADYALREIPSWMSDDQAILMTDMLPSGAFGARNAAVEPGSTVVVVGLGPIGLSAAACAQLQQPARILGFDLVESRRNRAERLGIETFTPGDAGIASQVLEATRGRGADSVIEAVGSTPTLIESVRSARVGGTVAVIGIHVLDSVPISAVDLGVRNITLRFGTTDVPLMWRDLFGLVEQGQLELPDVFTHRLPLSRASDGYRLFADRDAFKVVFDAQA